MKENEIKLINIIKEHKNPNRAIEIAIDVILEFLVQDVSSQEQPVACVRVSV